MKQFASRFAASFSRRRVSKCVSDFGETPDLEPLESPSTVKYDTTKKNRGGVIASVPLSGPPLHSKVLSASHLISGADLPALSFSRLFSSHPRANHRYRLERRNHAVAFEAISRRDGK